MVLTKHKIINLNPIQFSTNTNPTTITLHQFQNSFNIFPKHLISNKRPKSILKYNLPAQKPNSFAVDLDQKLQIRFYEVFKLLNYENHGFLDQRNLNISALNGNNLKLLQPFTSKIYSENETISYDFGTFIKCLSLLKII